MTRRKSHAFDSQKVGWTKTVVVVVVVVVFTLAYVTHKTIIPETTLTYCDLLIQCLIGLENVVRPDKVFKVFPEIKLYYSRSSGPLSFLFVSPHVFGG